MSQQTIPDDIQILLDCLSSHDELELEEMKPLRDWVKETPDGSLRLSAALAQNKQIESALAELEIPTPKQLRNQIHAYLEQNPELNTENALDDDLVRPASAKQVPFHRNPRVRYFSGLASGVAAAVLIWLSFVYVSDRISTLNERSLANSAVDWFEDAFVDDHSWRRDWPTGLEANEIDWPDEIRKRPYQWKQLATNYGQTTVFEFEPVGINQRAMLFMFETWRTCERRSLPNIPQYRYDENQMCVSVAKKTDGTHAYILAVEGGTEGYSRFLVPEQSRGQLVFSTLLKQIQPQLNP